MTWRTAPLPKDWPRIRARVLERDGHRCTEMVEGARCVYGATDVHHCGDPNDHSEGNLRSLCDWHHKRLTSQKANATRRRVTQRRQPERHPGLL